MNFKRIHSRYCSLSTTRKWSNLKFHQSNTDPKLTKTEDTQIDCCSAQDEEDIHISHKVLTTQIEGLPEEKDDLTDTLPVLQRTTSIQTESGPPLQQLETLPSPTAAKSLSHEANVPVSEESSASLSTNTANKK